MARRLLYELIHVAKRPAFSSRVYAEPNIRHSYTEQTGCRSHSLVFPQNSLQALLSSREDLSGADCAGFPLSEELSTVSCGDIVSWRSLRTPASSRLTTSPASWASGFYLSRHVIHSRSPIRCHAQKSFISSSKPFPAESCLHRFIPSSNSPLGGHMQKRFMSTPKIKLKVDRLLDAHAEIDKLMRPIFKIKTLIRRQENHIIKVKYLDIKRKHIGLATKPVGMKGYLKVYPNLFELFSFPNGTHLWCRLSKSMVDLLEEEKKIYLETEGEVVLKLRKLLMMSKDRCIKAGKFEFARKVLGFPEDFATRVAPAYPQYFNVVGSGPSPFIELVLWDDKIAVSELEKKAKEEAFKAGSGEIETRGQPLEFSITHSPGMFLKKKNLELLEKWQKLPYVSPYQDHGWVPIGTALSEKRHVAVLHELLSLSIEKRSLLMVLGRFKEEFDLPQSLGKLVNRFPGIFYLSLIGNMKTVFLREAYKEFQHIENYVRQGKPEAKIIEDHPLLRWRMKIANMARDGPQLYAAQKEKANEGRKQGSTASVNVSESDEDEDEEEDEDEGGAAISDTDYVDSEGEELDTENECDEDDLDESKEKVDRKSKTCKRGVKVQKEIW